MNNKSNKLKKYDTLINIETINTSNLNTIDSNNYCKKDNNKDAINDLKVNDKKILNKLKMSNLCKNIESNKFNNNSVKNKLNVICLYKSKNMFNLNINNNKYKSSLRNVNTYLNKLKNNTIDITELNKLKLTGISNKNSLLVDVDNNSIAKNYLNLDYKNKLYKLKEIHKTNRLLFYMKEFDTSINSRFNL